MSEKDTGCLKGFLIVSAVLVGGFILCMFSMAALIGSVADGDSTTTGEYLYEVLEDEKAKKDLVAIVDVDQVITSYEGYSDALIQQLKDLRENDDVKAVILNLNTPGGEVTATDEIYHELQKLRKEKKVIGCIRSIAASGGYYLAAGCDYVVANRLSLTGSIGVIIGTYNMADLLKKIGVESVVYKSGELKDVLSASRKLSLEEQKRQDELVQSMVDESFEEFAKVVAKGRKLSLERVKDVGIGDARILSGAKAFELGLVDELGYLEDAFSKAKELAGLEKANLVRSTSPQTLHEFLFGFQSQFDKGLLERISAKNFVPKPGSLYYLAPGCY